MADPSGLPLIADNHWANGCHQCSYGYVSAPEILGALPLSEGRAIQAGEHLVVFCNCRAGHMARQYLRKVYAGLSMEAKRVGLEHVAAAMPAPTVHYEGVA